ncbi:MAG: hypothetical protein HKN70_00025 [Gammaproteobacteria bacterium]|nr:hypothetical protein [Gammaproteobacteria bacterium]
MRRLLQLYSTILLSGLICVTAHAGTASTGASGTKSVTDTVAALHAKTINARDLKTLHYMENAHGQLEEWSNRLLSRLENGMGPRGKDPVLDGRADLQVQKIAITYASYTHNDALSETLRHVAQAHRTRLTALQSMVDAGPDRQQFELLSDSVNELITELRTWSEKR